MNDYKNVCDYNSYIRVLMNYFTNYMIDNHS